MNQSESILKRNRQDLVLIRSGEK